MRLSVGTLRQVVKQDLSICVRLRPAQHADLALLADHPGRAADPDRDRNVLRFAQNPATEALYARIYDALAA